MLISRRISLQFSILLAFISTLPCLLYSMFSSPGNQVVCRLCIFLVNALSRLIIRICCSHNAHSKWVYPMAHYEVFLHFDLHFYAYKVEFMPQLNWAEHSELNLHIHKVIKAISFEFSNKISFNLKLISNLAVTWLSKFCRT